MGARSLLGGLNRDFQQKRLAKNHQPTVSAMLVEHHQQVLE